MPGSRRESEESVRKTRDRLDENTVWCGQSGDKGLSGAENGGVDFYRKRKNFTRIAASHKVLLAHFWAKSGK